MTFDRDAFLMRAVETPSHEDVDEIRSLVRTTLETAGVDSHVDEMGNVIATRDDDAGGEASPHLVLNTHIDTVPPELPVVRDGDVLKGRGACDAKGPLAAYLDAFLSATIADGRVTLAITPDEETTQFGGNHLGERLTADGYIVGEPTNLDVCIAARGQFEGEIIIRGESAHASEPDAGKNPIRALTTVIESMDSYDEERGPDDHKLLGTATLTPTKVVGGGALNQVPAECTVSFDRRTVPPETIPEFFAAFADHLQETLPAGFELEVGPVRAENPGPEAFETDPGSALVRILEAESGGTRRPFEAATEASYFAGNAPTVVFGPGVLRDEEGPVAHADREYVHLGSVERAAEILERTIEGFLSEAVS